MTPVGHEIIENFLTKSSKGANQRVLVDKILAEHNSEFNANDLCIALGCWLNNSTSQHLIEDFK